MKQQKSTWLTKQSAQAQREWFVVDVAGKSLGRAATKIAMVLRGKHKPTFTPNMDMGDFVVVVNADKIQLTGNKLTNKQYREHTLYPGGLKELSAKEMLAKHPDQLIHKAVWGMLPKGRLGRKIIKKLKVFAGPEHNHTAQLPRPLELN
jgi:large subunit ribosomal protein L13